MRINGSIIVVFVVLSFTISIVLSRKLPKYKVKSKNSEDQDTETSKEASEEYADDEDGDDEKVGKVSLGNFESYAHSLAGEVFALDEKTIEIDGLVYDGLGPAAWFMLGKTGRASLPEFTDLEGTVVPDDNESCDTLGGYSGEDIKIKLPGKMKLQDYDFISMYCLRFRHNFGYVMIPDDIKLKKVNGTSKVKECDQDDLDEGGDSAPSGGGGGGRPRPGGPPRGPPIRGGPPSSSGGNGILGGIVNAILG